MIQLDKIIQLYLMNHKKWLLPTFYKVILVVSN